MADIEFNSKDFEDKLKKFGKDIMENRKKAILNVANDILRRSQSIVPHDIGTLQNSGHVEDGEDDSAIVGYGGNAAPYAARLHEHPEYNFQKGRKGKYLESPIKENLTLYKQYFQKILG